VYVRMQYEQRLVCDEAASISAMSCVTDGDAICTLVCVVSRMADDDNDDDDDDDDDDDGTDGDGGDGRALQSHYRFVSQARLTLPTQH